MTRRAVLVGVVLLTLGVAPRPATASIILGGSLFVEQDGDVTAKFLFSDAAFNSDLFLFDPVNGLGFLFDNHTTLPGTTINLGNFSAGTELIFGLLVHNTDIPADYSLFTGPGGLNPDLFPHALVIDDPFNDLADPPPPPFPVGILAFLSDCEVIVTPIAPCLLPGETVVGFEDRLVNDPLNDFDYNDHVFAFSNVSAVPEPATVLLFGAGAVGLLARRRRTKQSAR